MHTHNMYTYTYTYTYIEYIFLLMRFYVSSRAQQRVCRSIESKSLIQQDKDRGYNSARRSSFLRQRGLSGWNHSATYGTGAREKKSRISTDADFLQMS